MKSGSDPNQTKITSYYEIIEKNDKAYRWRDEVSGIIHAAVEGKKYCKREPTV